LSDFSQRQGSVLAISHDGKTILIEDPTGSIVLCARNTGKPLRPPLHVGGKVKSATFSPNGNTVLIGGTVAGGAGNVWLWGVADGNLIWSKPQPSTVLAVAFSHNGKTILTGSLDGKVQLWNGTPDGLPARTINHGKGVGRANEVSAVAISLGDKILASGGRDGLVRLWDLRTGEPLRHINKKTQARKTHGDDYMAPLGHRDKITTLAFSSDGQTILTGSWDRTARLWDTVNGKPLGPPLLHEDKVVAAAFERQAGIFWTGTRAGAVRSWEQGASCKLPLRHNGTVWGASFSPDGKTIATGTVLPREKGEVRVWDAVTGKPGWLKPQDYPVVSVAFSPDGKTILTGSGPAGKKWGEVCLLDAATGERLDNIPKQTRGIKGVLFHPTGEIFLSSCTDGTVQLWDTVKVRAKQADKPFRVLEHHKKGVGLEHDKKGVGAVAFSPNGKFIATGGEDKTALLWNMESDEPILKFLVPPQPVCNVGFSPDSQTLVVVDYGGGVGVFDTTTGKPTPTRIIERGNVFWSVAVAPNGKGVLTGSGDGSETYGEARLWDWGTLKPLGPPWPHHGGVLRVAFNSKGDRFLTGSYDENVRIWDVPTPVRGDAERVVLWTQIITGLELDDQGVVRVLDERTWRQRRQRLSELGGPPVP
jgi:WD40 repeat protein